MVGALRKVQAHVADRRSLLIGFRGKGHLSHVINVVTRLGSPGKGRVLHFKERLCDFEDGGGRPGEVMHLVPVNPWSGV